MAQEQNYKYIAFISYSGADIKEASRLKRRLRKFRLPAFMKKEDTSKHLSVFMADKDFNEHKVISGLHKKLDESKFLIVVCSPNSAKSLYCEEEVSYFMRTGRSERIIPYIILGKPNSEDPEIECYVNSLKNLPDEEQITGIYTPKVGQYSGYLMAVSRILNIEYDSIKIDDWKRRIRKYVSLAAVAVLVSIGSISIANYYMPHYEYYADYVDKNGLPEGLFPLNREMCNHRPSFYKFEYRQKKIYSTSFENSFGIKLENGNTEMVDRPCVREFQYNKRGGIEIICKNSKGQVLWVETVSPDKSLVGLKQYESDNGVAVMRSLTDISSNYGSSFTDFNIQQVYLSSKSTVRGYILTRDDDGYIIQRIFSSSSDNSSDEPGRDENGIEGMQYELDSLHRIRKITYVNAEGEIISDKIGISSKELRYDSDGNISGVEYKDINGYLSVNQNLWAEADMSYNQYGQISVQKTYDKNHNLCNDKFGVAITEYKWSDRGLLLETSCYNNIEEPVNILPNDKNIPIAHKLIYKYDQNGHAVEMRCYDEKNELVTVGETAYYTFEYDSEDRIVLIACKDENGNPSYGTNAASVVKITYSNNNPVGQEFFDVEGRYTNTIEGFAYVVRDYDSNNRLKKEVFFDKYNLLVPNNNLGGAAGVKLTYNNRTGNLEKTEFLYATEPPANNQQRLEVVYSKYDKRGLCIEERNTSMDGKLYSKTKMSYDSLGNKTSIEYYDSNEELSINSQFGCAKMLFSYDNRGRIIEQKSYGTDNNLMINNQGWAVSRFYYYDDEYKTISVFYYNELESPISPSQQGAHEIRTKYVRNQCVSVECYDRNKKPITNSTFGCWKKTIKYSKYGYPISFIFYDVNDEKINGKDGFCEERIEYTASGWPISVSYMDKDGKRATSISNGYSYVINDYLYNGLQYQTAFFNSEEKAINGPNGFHSMHICYDSHFNIYNQYCRDANGELAHCKQWSAVAGESAYDSDGRRVYLASFSDIYGNYSNRMVLLDTLNYPTFIFQDFYGGQMFYDGEGIVEFEVRDQAQLDALIDERIAYLKQQYSEREGVQYLEF